MKIRTSFRALLLPLLCLGAMAHAQPDTNNAPKADNPTNRAPRAARPNREMQRDMTPEERMKWLVKRQFSNLGASEATQETLVAFISEETKARQELTEKSRPLQNALRADALTDAQVAALLNSYQVALEDEKARRAKAVADLEKSIDLKNSPKIEAALTLAGVIGDGPMLNMGGGMGRLMMGGMGRGQNERGQNERGQNERGQNGQGGRGQDGRDQNGGENGRDQNARRQRNQNRNNPNQNNAPAPVAPAVQGA